MVDDGDDGAGQQQDEGRHDEDQQADGPGLAYVDGDGAANQDITSIPVMMAASSSYMSILPAGQSGWWLTGDAAPSPGIQGMHFSLHWSVMAVSWRVAGCGRFLGVTMPRFPGGGVGAGYQQVIVYVQMGALFQFGQQG